MDKNTLRNTYREKRNALNTKEVLFFSKQITNQVLQYLDNINFKNLHIFLSIAKNNEIQTSELINHLSTICQLHTSITKGNILEHVELQEGEYTLGKWNIPIPPTPHVSTNLSDIDIVFVPLLICDIYGNRIGYGKGYYDAFLAQLPKNCLKIGLNFFEPVEKVESESHDIPLDILITPNKVHTFANN